ncbi:MAG: ABC transporter permease [Bacteroidetes bacterium]|nr:ABC transporter permease [Bacteroidota bacterium]
MWKVFSIEVYKIFKRPRTYIAFAAISALILIIQLGLYVDGNAYVDFIMSGLKDSFDFQGKILNGYLVCYILLQLLLVHVPLLIALVAADLVSGEANMGTLRLLLTKPQSKTTFMLGKFLAASFYTLLLLIWIAFLALAVSVWLFGTGDLIIQKNAYVVQIAQNDILWRYGYAFLFAFVAMLAVTALGFFLSVFSENSIGPIVATISIIIFFTIMSTMGIPLFQKIQPYLFTTHMVNWKEFFDEQLDTSGNVIKGSIQNMQQVNHSIIILSIYIIVFVWGAITFFKQKDILS